MSIVPDKWFVDPVVVSTFQGSGSLGSNYSDPIPMFGNVSATRTLVRDSSGREVTAEITVRLPPEHDGSPTLPMVPAESQVTVEGYSGSVITAKPLKRFGVTGYVEITVA